MSSSESFICYPYYLNEILPKVDLQICRRLSWISFDISSMYPSIPIEETLQLVPEEILKHKLLEEIAKWKLHAIFKISRICMEIHFKKMKPTNLHKLMDSQIGTSVLGWSYLRYFYGQDLKIIYNAFGNIKPGKQPCLLIS